ncbi:MAG: VanZ family protein [Candidatus Omnitrophota bacterium]|nr:VanZ family protein [Candidatus Omnitrophota bacterium]MBU1929334.1 VanZ family protein [Candidatus Omnitrophota bacterium]MBU2035626.1 VanZ family protein [Candidatus Omnitrophota bacterium]MBU2221125.1 VanZ family protein [Candidatus Omnitrophota bacterium]
MKLLKLWFPVLFWCWLIFYISGISSLETPWGLWDFVLRKISHITEYFILTLLLYRAFKGTFIPSRLNLFFWPGALSILYAVSDEIHQYFVPTRGPSLEDVLIDCAGIIIFYVSLKYLKKFIRKL